MTILRRKLKRKMSHEKNVKRGRRNRQRGAELQRQVVNLAKGFDLVAHNRDRGGAQHEMGDVEIEDKYFFKDDDKDYFKHNNFDQRHGPTEEWKTLPNEIINEMNKKIPEVFFTKFLWEK